MCNIKMTETELQHHNPWCYKRLLSSKWSLLKLFYFTALQVDHTHDEKSTAALSEGLWKTLEMLTGF